MTSRVVLYFGLLAIGWFLSNRGKIHDNLMKRISAIQSIILFALIFIMGVRIGMDEQILSSIGQIGVIAGVFAIVTMLISILFVYLARRKVISDPNITGGKDE